MLCLLASAVLAGSVAFAGSPEPDTESPAGKAPAIPFADFRGQVRDWRSEGRNAILIESNTGQWYRAEFMSACHGLPFADTIGFVLDARSRVDRFGSIIVRGSGGIVDECWFKSFAEIPDPDKAGTKAKQDGSSTETR
ncbi:MAG: hypothetical protein D6763_11480 [Alphaproteobacteria bacterium]|nr:MAG: hypothetical protein D6763_11480 [Alphaproteobacteria bacterium]